MDYLRYILLLICGGSFAGHAQPAAQTPAAGKPQPDVLILIDDEKVLGRFVGSNGMSVSFKSDLLGDVTADWSKIKELHTQGRYAVLSKEVQLRPHADTSNIPQGRLEATGQNITISSAAGAEVRIPVGEAAQVLEEATFQKLVSPPHIGFTEAWTGTVTGGASIVEATQQSRTFTGGVGLVRAIPPEANLPARNRTTFDFNFSDGHLNQPNTASIKTEIFHVDGERDEYFTTSRVFGFGQVAFDHNFSQGLTLQQNYAGGIGWTVIKQANETLDLKGGLGFIRQHFEDGARDHSLAASNFSENLLRKFGRGFTFTEQLVVTPTWNDLNQWLASASAAINIPVYKRFTFTVGANDNYLYNPPPGFHRNSFVATTGLTYALK